MQQNSKVEAAYLCVERPYYMYSTFLHSEAFS